MMGMFQKGKRLFLLAALIFVMCPYGRAQIKAFRYKANVQKVDSSGVYRIELRPGLIAKSNESLSDIRLVDNTGKNVAFILSTRLVLNNPDSFIIFPEVNAGNVTDTAVVYIAENKNALNISQLWLRLKKAAVNRTVNLSGSDDLKNWFAIKEDIPLEQAGEGNQSDYQQSLTFPTSNYRYFKVQVNGKNKIPVKILQAGIYTTSLNKPVFASLPPLHYSTSHSGKKTKVLITFNQAFLVNKLHFNIARPKFYNRRISVYAVKARNADEKLTDTVLNSSGSQDVILSAKEKQIGINIYNGDDNHLMIKNITAFQTKIYAICYLEGGKSYKLLTGNHDAKTADYDLSFLNNRAYNQLPGITHSDMYNNPAYIILPHPDKHDDNSIWLWTALILGLLILSFLTFRMVREIK